MAAHVHENHVHVVVESAATPEDVMNALEAYASRALNTAAIDPPARKRWARHGSTRHLWNHDQTPAATPPPLRPISPSRRRAPPAARSPPPSRREPLPPLASPPSPRPRPSAPASRDRRASPRTGFLQSPRSPHPRPPPPRRPSTPS